MVTKCRIQMTLPSTFSCQRQEPTPRKDCNIAAHLVVIGHQVAHTAMSTRQTTSTLIVMESIPQTNHIVATVSPSVLYGITKSTDPPIKKGHLDGCPFLLVVYYIFHIGDGNAHLFGDLGGGLVERQQC